MKASMIHSVSPGLANYQLPVERPLAIYVANKNASVHINKQTQALI